MSRARQTIESLFQEMAAPSEELRSRTFYHGTNRVPSADSILRGGIQPGVIEVKRGGFLTPVAGRVYLTEQLDYALMYAAGGNILGRGDNNANAGKPGFIFVIPGTELADVHPDEDDIGWIYYNLSPGKRWDSASKKWADKDPLEELNRSIESGYEESGHKRLAQALLRDQHMRGVLKYLGDTYLTDIQKRKIRDGELAYWAAGGKRILKRMSDATKLWIVSNGGHVANAGTVKPSQAWQFDLGQAGDIARDGSNFFEIAKRIA